MHLIDTNIASELLRPRPNRGVLNWASGESEFAMSAIAVEESIFGLQRRDNSILLSAYASFLADRCSILPVTESIARQAGNLRGAFARRGIVRAQADMLIAATAQIHALTLVTRNTRDFESCGIALLNPFTD